MLMSLTGPKLHLFDRGFWLLLLSELQSVLHIWDRSHVSCREKLKIPANVIDQLVAGAQSDIRQVLNMLSTWKLLHTSMDFDEGKDLYVCFENKIRLCWLSFAPVLRWTRNTLSWVPSISPPSYLAHTFSLLLVEKRLVKKWSTISRTILSCHFSFR